MTSFPSLKKKKISVNNRVLFANFMTEVESQDNFRVYFSF